MYTRKLFRGGKFHQQFEQIAKLLADGIKATNFNNFLAYKLPYSFVLHWCQNFVLIGFCFEFFLAQKASLRQKNIGEIDTIFTWWPKAYKAPSMNSDIGRSVNYHFILLRSNFSRSKMTVSSGTVGLFARAASPSPSTRPRLQRSKYVFDLVHIFLNRKKVLYDNDNYDSEIREY